MDTNDSFMALPRLAGRLTADLITNAPQGLNVCSEYELDLRGHKIGVIENLGATHDQFDSLDLSGNEIVKLEGFPRLNRLHTLTLCNNRLVRIGVTLESTVPNLKCLNLTNNRIASFGDIDALAGLKKLTHVSFLGNPVSKREDYRGYVAHQLPHVICLDFSRIKKADRDAAGKKFGGEHGSSNLKKALAKSNTYVPGVVEHPVDSTMEPEAAPTTAPIPAQMLALKAAIANAATLEEVSRLERALTTGQMPSDLIL